MDPVELLNLRQEVIPALLEEWEGESHWGNYSVVAFTCTFEQFVPCVALARAMKQRPPKMITVFRGFSLDVDNSTEYMRELDWINYILLSDGNRSFSTLLQRLAHGERMSDIAGIVFRNDVSVMQVEPKNYHELDALPAPDYTEYFDTIDMLERDKVLGTNRRVLPNQTARRCWWARNIIANRVA